MGKGRSREPEFVERQAAAASARKAMLEKFLAKTDPDAAARLRARAAEAANPSPPQQVRDTAKAEKTARTHEAPPAAKREASPAQPAPAEKAEPQRATKKEQKPARDARHAASKTKGKVAAKKGKR